MFGKMKHGHSKSGGRPEPDSGSGAAASPARPASQRSDATGLSQAPPAVPRVTEMTRRPFEHPDAQQRSEPPDVGNAEGKKLIVGREICLSGEIKTCDVLVVEGRVEAALSDTRSLEIAESGYFKGSAIIEEADISGRYEGDLDVSGCLRIRSTGLIQGKVHYGELEIERGGQITGTVDISDAASASSGTRLTPADFAKDSGAEMERSGESDSSGLADRGSDLTPAESDNSGTVAN